MKARITGLLLPAMVAFVAIPALAQETGAGLPAALQAAVSRHPAIAGKQAQVDASAAGADATRTQRYPSLSAQLQRYDGNGTVVGGSPAPTNWRARQPLWAFGRIDSAIAAADADTAVQRADFLRVRRQVIEQTAVAYAQVLGARERVRLAQENVEVLRQLSDQIRRRERGQLASRADVSLAASRLAQAQATGESYQGDLEVAQHELLALTQVPVVADQPVPPALTTLPAGDALLAEAQERSADVVYKQQSLARAEAGIAQVRTEGLPTVYLQAERTQGQPGVIPGTHVSVVLEGALEGLGAAELARGRGAAAQAEAARADLLSTRNDVTRNVHRLESERAARQRLADANASALQDLEQLFASYRRQYEAGTKSWLDLLNIERELSDQRLQQAQAENDWLVLTLQLAAESGRLDPWAGLAEE